jgi:hypothetical protein
MVHSKVSAVWYEPDGMKRAMLLLNLMNQQVRVGKQQHALSYCRERGCSMNRLTDINGGERREKRLTLKRWAR